MRKTGLPPITQHQSWIQKSRISQNDRAKYEHESLSRVMDFMILYDQLNVANLARAERITKRLMILEQAYREGDTPNYDGAAYMQGDEVAEDPSFVGFKVRRYVADQFKDDSQIQKEKRKANEEKAAKKNRNKTKNQKEKEKEGEG